MKYYQVIIEMDNDFTVFENTNKEEKVDKIISAYVAERPRSIKVYELNRESNQYVLMRNMTKRPEVQAVRPIGFGRW